MPHRSLNAVLLAQVFLCAALVTPALAASPQFLPVDPMIGPNTASGATGCVIAPYSPGGLLSFWGDADRFDTIYHLVQPASCTECGGAPLEIKSIAYTGRTVGDPTCNYRVEVSIVGTDGGSCPSPDETVVLCPPTVVTVTVLDVSGPVTVPLPPGCCITEDAYVKLRFLDDETCGNGSGFLQPNLLNGVEACAPCDQYFTTLVNEPVLTDMCNVFSSNMYFSVDADCCGATPTLPRTWGRVKTLYR